MKNTPTRKNDYFSYEKLRSLRYQDGHGSEKISSKVTFLSLKLQDDDPNSLTMSNVG